jgi:putative component of membrane protein insertase Oxa1/YidC/SpoIIIJ protein YidD
MKVGQTLARAWENLRNNFSQPSPAQVLPIEAGQSKDWALLVYLEGQDGLAFSSQQAVEQLRANSGDSIHVAVAHHHQATLKEKLLPGMGATHRSLYQIQSGQVRHLGEAPKGLGEFVSWGIKNFPAKQYAVVVKRHGMGFLDARQLRQELEKSQTKVDLLAFDSCLMQQAEVAYELRERAEVMTAGANNVPAGAYPYAKVGQWLSQNASRLDAANLGRLIVEGHRLQGANLLQSATQLDQMQPLANSVAQLTQTVFAEKTPPELIYTAMQKVPSIEGQSIGHIAFDYRDLSSFAQNLADHPELKSEKVQQACREVLEKVNQSLLRHQVGGPYRYWENARGFTTYMPWRRDDERKSEYAKLQWATDTQWDKLVDYAHQVGKQLDESHPVTKHTGNQLAKVGLYAYKKYISPYLGKACTMTPSCSAYARQAIETHGLWEGIKFTTVRLCSCNGSFCGCHPVPGRGPEAEKPSLNKVILQSAPAPVSRLKEQLSGGLARMAGWAGRAIGAVTGALVAAPAGLVAGAILGHQAGQAQLDAFNDRLFQRYQPPSAEAFMQVEAPLVKLPLMVQEKLAGSWAEPLSPWLGALSGAAAGLAGGVAVGASWGQKFTGLLAENATRDALGILPPNPAVAHSLATEHAL